MSQLSKLQLPLELAYHRRVLFAVELLDGVTLERVSEGFSVVADGLRGTPTVNTSGLFVWLEEDFTRLRKLSIEPGLQPYEKVDREPAQVKRPLTTVELPPRVDYRFTAGITGLRGTLFESRVAPPLTQEPVKDAEVSLRWLDDNAQWHDARLASHSDTQSGDFVSILRLTPDEVPLLDASGHVTVRLKARRDVRVRTSTDFKLQQGRVTDPSKLNPRTFFWDEMLP